MTPFEKTIRQFDAHGVWCFKGYVLEDYFSSFLDVVWRVTHAGLVKNIGMQNKRIERQIEVFRSLMHKSLSLIIYHFEI